jgi:hypothetical protein
MATVHVTHNLLRLAQLPRFVSINSAVEIDLQGQSNGETLGEVQSSGVGGSLDYIEAAALSAGGLSILALPSTTEDGKHSKIVSRLTAGAVVTTPEVLHGLYRDGVWRCAAQGSGAPGPRRGTDRHCASAFPRRVGEACVRQTGDNVTRQGGRRGSHESIALKTTKNPAGCPTACCGEESGQPVGLLQSRYGLQSKCSCRL